MMPSNPNIKVCCFTLHRVQMGMDVLGGYMSPVHGAYGKQGLEATHHRINMCHLAAASSPVVMVDEWEVTPSSRKWQHRPMAAPPQAGQAGYVRTVHVLQRVHQALHAAFSANAPLDDTAAAAAAAPNAEATAPHADAVRDAIAAMAAPRLRTQGSPSEGPLSPGPSQEAPLRVMLLCGADLLASMLQPGVWQEAHLRTILGEHGVVVVGRCVGVLYLCGFYLHSSTLCALYRC